MDCTGFGMGCCCLQVTFQAESIDEARFLYDQLTPLTPLLLAMTASSPVWRGYLADVDTRWSVLSASLDDRTDEELGLKPLHTDKFVIRKPRYDSIDSYLCKANSRYNDIPLVIDQSVYDRLVRSGVDHLLAQHIAHLYIREPLVLFKEKLDELLEKESRSGESKADPKEAEDTDVESFENIQSTNWQNMRFKPPPIKSDSSANRIGWRVEVRPMELQLTDFENSAFCSLVILLVKALRKMKLNLLMPISKVDENMKRAQRVNACLAEKFFFRKNINEAENENQCELVEMSVDEIMNGSGEFKGMLNVLHEYLDSLCEDEDDDTELDSLIVLKKNLKFLELRANGTLLTPASYMRKFIREHPLYKFDSVVTHEINYDLLRNIHAVATKEIPCPELLLPEKMELSELRVTQSA
jgi:glutamate--cysteine ligase catalytic subunit